jgi:Ca2+-binding RTX toxin-like protein
MKIARDTALPNQFNTYQIKIYPIQMSGGFEPVALLDEIPIISYSSSKVIFGGGGETFEISGNFGAQKITKMSDLYKITSNFTSVAQFQEIDGVKYFRLLIERTSTDANFSVSKFVSGLENDDLRFLLAGDDVVHGTKFNNGDDVGGLGKVVTGDILNGSGGNDKIYGYAGNDEIWGGSGGDLIDGGVDSDDLLGGGGNDILIGGRGNDVLYGGSGLDYFDFNSVLDSGVISATRDVIKDFSKSQGDKIDLRTIDAKISTTNNDAFSFIGSAPTNNSASQASNGKLWYADGILYGSTDSDKAAEFSIQVTLTGISASNAAEYVFL